MEDLVDDNDTDTLKMFFFCSFYSQPAQSLIQYSALSLLYMHQHFYTESSKREE